ncbi:MAG: choice-of-anchor tandem repeat GloVer-containing protein [Candidatus Sulfotelmatobacter sp.]
MTIKMHSAKSDRPKPSYGNRGIRRSWIPYSIGLALALVALLAPPSPAQAQTYIENTIYSFPGGDGGIEPLFSGVVRDSEGNFYGTTYAGGPYNYGTVFKVDAAGNETVLHGFGQANDGRTPYSGLVLDPTGHLFGTTYGGGLRDRKCRNGCGIVFEIFPNGDEKILHGFGGVKGDGSLPIGSLIRDAAGNFYGTTQMGGTYGYGTVFKIDGAGTETVLYSFGDGPDGAYPAAGVIEDSAGNLYGTASGGGSYTLGTVFKLDPSGHETVLHNFAGGSDGSAPMAGLVQDPRGNLYGTTFEGGYGEGTVFEVDTNGHETVLQDFGENNSGAYPESTLVRDSQGNLYGSTIQGGLVGPGAVFKVSSQGAFSVLYSFAGEPDGAGPEGPLMIDSAGTLYGTTASGGTTNNGTVFHLTP